MPLIGNVSNTYNYYSDRELLMEILGKINYIDMALNTLLETIQDVKNGLAVVSEKLTVEKEQIAAKFAELTEQIAALDNSQALLAAAADLEANVVGALTAMATEIEGIIPDAPVDPVDPPVDPVDPIDDNGEGED